MIFHTDTMAVLDLLQTSEQLQHSSLDSAVIYAQRALHLSTGMRYGRGTATALALIGYYYRKQGNYTESILFLQRAADTAKRYGGDYFLLNMYINIGASYAEQGSYGMGSLYYYKALQYFKQHKIKKSEYLGQIYSGLGTMWASLSEEERALKYLDSAERVMNSSGDTASASYIYLSRAKVFFKSNKSLAKYNVLKSLDNATRYRQPVLRLASLTYLGTVYVEEGNIDSGFYYLHQAWAISQQIPDFKAGVLPALYLAHAYYHNKDYLLAEKYLNVLEKGAPGRELMGEIYQLKAQVYAALGRDADAYRYQQKSMVFKDSILNFEKSRTTDMLLAYETAEKDYELSRKQLIIQRQESEIRQKKIWIATGGMGFVLIGTIIFFIFQSTRRKQQVAILNLQKERLKALMEGEEKERERIARELHDGIGSLISAAKMHLNHGAQSLVQQPIYIGGLRLLDEAYEELRLAAHNMVPMHLLEEGLTNAMVLYCKRISNLPDFRVECLLFGAEPNLPQEQELSIYRAIQELIHNARKHGGATEINIHINNHDDFNISIEDNGRGLKKEEVEKGSGLWNIKERLALWDGRMEVDNRPDMGMTVYLHFPARV